MKGWLLDTDVVSELVRPRPESRVLDWLRSLVFDRVFISVMTLGEIDQGIAALKPGDPRRDLYDRFRHRTEAEFAGRILSLDDETVRLWGGLSGRYRLDFGGKAPVVDTLLAATAQRNRLHIATRNVRDIRRVGGSAFDPWTDDPRSFPLQA